MWTAELTFRDELASPGARVHVSPDIRALHFGIFWFPHDDPLAPNASRGLCLDRGPPIAVQDYPRATNEYTRVVILLDGVPRPLPPERTTYSSSLFQYRVDVWGENRLRGRGLPSNLRVLRPGQRGHAVKRVMGAMTLLVVVWTTFVVFATGLQKGTARFPKFSVACHLLFLVLTLAITTEMMCTTESPSVLVCLVHIAMDSVASALAVYIPSEEHKMKGVPRLARWSRYCRRTTEFAYAVWRIVGIITGLRISRKSTIVSSWSGPKWSPSRRYCLQCNFTRRRLSHRLI